MKGEVKLYIGGVPVELTNNIDILFTYSVDELTNPTVVKNSYSKTITIENTPENSKIFGQFWNVERIQTIDGEYGTSFNPSKRVPFTIYVNGEIFQSGYAKLLNVKTTKGNSTYEISLFGGLGSFFYNLSFHGDENEGDNKKKLSDLHFMIDSTTPSEREFDFVIKKETVKEAWDNIDADDSSLWHYINFADCYDGIPDDFDADKVLVNLGEEPEPEGGTTPGRRPGGRTTAKSFITTTATTDGNYASYDGYVVAELPKEHTAAEMREFRSYLMRPVVRVKEVINACCAPENNGGFEVQLDDTFFNEDNPYWEKAWMTLPLLTSMDFNGNEGDDQSGVTVTVGSTTSGGTTTGEIYTETTTFTIGEITANTSFNIAMDVNLLAVMNSLPSGYVTTDSNWVKDHSTAGGMYMSPSAIYPCAYSTASNTMYPGAIEVQLVAYSRDGKVITGSEVYNCTSGYNPHRASQGGRGGNTTTSTYVPNPNDFTAFTPGYETTYTTKSGEFNFVSGNTWKMKDKLSFILRKLPKTCTLKLIVSKVNACTQSISNKAMAMYQRYYSNYTTDSQGYLDSSYSTYYRTNATVNRFDYEISNVMVSLTEGEEAIRTGAKFGKADLLNTDYTPADFLLSYGKLFGLYFEKDAYEDVIYIRTRDTFYRKDNVHDLSKDIDRSRTYQITPLVFDAKWYNWKLSSEASQFGEQYKATYGNEYGIQRVNTGYNFDSSEKDLYKDNVFKSGIEALEKSDMYSYVSADTTWKPWMFDGYTYNLYNVNDMEDTFEFDMPSLTKKGVLTSFSNYKYYDLYSKLQLHTDDNSAADGANILVFNNGSIPTKTWNTDVDLYYWITDDNSYMSTLNDSQPCWLYTTSETDKDGMSIAIQVTEIPQFSRYLVNNSGNVSLSWDFGYPKQIFVPDYSLDFASTLYTNYWQSYIRDMYDVNSKKLSCYVKFDRRPAMEWLRDFYWFDNSIWRINKIEDYNAVTEDSTKAEFIKVQDMSAYTNTNISTIPDIAISASTNSITNSATTVTIHVTVSDGGDWYVSDDVYTSYNASASSGHGNGSFTVQIPANVNNYAKIHYIKVQNAYGQWAWCEIAQGNVTLSVTEFAQYKGQDIPWTGGTQMYDVRSTYPWTVTNMENRDYATLDPISGTGGTYANHFECTFEATDSLAERNVWMRFTDSQGNYVDVWKWQEKCAGLVYENSGGTQTVNYLSGYNAVAPEWITVVDNGDNTYEIIAIENGGEERYTTVYLTNNSGESTTVEVFQYSGSTAGSGVFDVQRTDGTGNILTTGGTAVLHVNSLTGWTVTTESAFVTLSISGSTETDDVTVTFADNTGVTRQAVFEFIDEDGVTIEYSITQSGVDGGSVTGDSVTPAILLYDATGGTQSITVNIEDSWQIVGYPTWIAFSPSAGTGTTSVSVTAIPYSGVEQRSGSLVIVNLETSAPYIVTCIQQAASGGEEILAVSPSALRFTSSGGTAQLTIIANTDWTIG